MTNQVLKQEAQPAYDAIPADNGFANRRRHVRIYYPENCPKKFLPELILNYRAYPVLDISEGGVRFAAPNAALIKDGPITAGLRFPDGDFIDISGVVVRRMRNQIALMLEKGIPYCRIMSEQLRLKNLENNGVIA